MLYSFSSRCVAVLALVLPTLQCISAAAIPALRAGAPIDGVNVTVSPLPLVFNETATITWTGGDEPWKLLIGTGGYYSPEGIDWRIEENSLEIKQVNWTVSFDVGESVIFQVWDVENKTGYRQNMVIEAPGNGTTNGTTSGTVSSSTVLIPPSASETAATSSVASAAPSGEPAE